MNNGPQRELPYPVTPVSSETSGGSRAIPNGQYKTTYTKSQSDDLLTGRSNSTDAWATLARPAPSGALPPAVRVTERRDESKANTEKIQKEEDLPLSLQAGAANFTPRSSIESQRSMSFIDKTAIASTRDSMQTSPSQTQNSNNPFFRITSMEESVSNKTDVVEDNSMDVWASTGHSLPSQSLGPLSEKPSLDKIPTHQPFSEPWVSFSSPSSPLQQGSPVPEIPLHSSISNGAISLNPYQELNGNPFQEQGTDKQEPYGNTLGSLPSNGAQIFINDHTSELQELEGRWPGSIADFSPGPSHDVGKGIPFPQVSSQDVGPELPPRRPHEQEDSPPPQPPRPPVKEENPPPQPPRPKSELKGGNIEVSPLQTASAIQYDHVANQRNKTYQVKLVDWLDISSAATLRRSPIMIQNANGPCPLLALVNALILSTPANVETTLVETLRVREQISLGFLLDAVIDELMSGRRGDAAQNLPDVSDLYAFLINLHTGMNVNPSFVPPDTEPASLLDVTIHELSGPLNLLRQPGRFEDTKEMRLYSTFAVPLIHGWMPPRNHPAFNSLKRSARNYEEAQNLMFREDELEYKLQRQGLDQNEQLILEDVTNVKYFLSSSATQLTGYGLDTITEALSPGSIAILFRNDHFSTLYKHPRSGQLFTLVTDLGYAGHEEVVWESLVDVSGEGCEFFAGDFRPVGNIAGDTHPVSNNADSNDNSRWTTVSRSNRNRRSRSSAPPTNVTNLAHNPSATDPSQPFSLLSIDEPTNSPMSPTTEQEDHDLALAMQLQEEEEDRERRETAARRRENELSQAYLSSQTPVNHRTVGQTSSRSFTGRRSQGHGRRSSAQPQESTPTNRKVALDDEEGPPPTYEQAAKGPAYNPSSDNSVHGYGSPDPVPTRVSNSSASRLQGTRPSRQTSAYIQNSSGITAFSVLQRGSSTVPTLATSPVVGRGDIGRRCSTGRYVDSVHAGRGARAGDGNRRRGAVVAADDDRRDCVIM